MDFFVFENLKKFNFWSKELSALAFLYFIQGVPYGFQVRFVPIYQRKQNISLTSIGLSKILLWPWLCKALWAPLIDKWKTEWHWLLSSILVVFLACIIGIFIDPDCVLCWCAVIFTLNVGTATQDIAVDSLAVKLLSFSQLGKGNTIQAVAYKVGSVFGGGILVLFINTLGISGIFFCLSVLYLESLVFIYVSPTLKAIAAAKKSEKENLNANQSALSSRFLWSIFTESNSIWVLIFVFTYKLGKGQKCL